MLIQILLHTPLWVWVLLTGLVALGLWQRRARKVARGQLLALPLALLVLGLWSMAPGFVAQPLVALAWLLCLGLATWAGRWLPAPAVARWLAEERRLWLPGSWWPLLFIVCIFGLRYSTGVALVLHPEWRSLLAVQLPLAVGFGLLSGLFLGRALGLWALTRRPAAALPVFSRSPLAGGLTRVSAAHEQRLSRP